MARKKLLPKTHTGKVVHHRHTSYASLAVVLLLAITPLAYASRSVAEAAATDPVTASEEVHAVVPGSAPTVAAGVNIPVSGAVFTTNDPVTVAGNCQNNTLLKVYKNDVFAGAVFCENGRFSLQIDLFLGTNTLIVRTFNANEIQGPDSNPIVVRHEVLGVSTTKPAVSSGQFFVTSDIFYRGVNVGDTLSWPLTLSGGQAPYAVSVGWGDGQSDLISRAEAGTFTIRHTYTKSGKGEKNSYKVTITASDQTGSSAFMQLVTIVSGDDESVVGAIKKGYDLSGPIRLAWQLTLGSAIVITAFWLGERREIWMMKRTAGKIYR